jgi:hypothetical protein
MAVPPMSLAEADDDISVEQVLNCVGRRSRSPPGPARRTLTLIWHRGPATWGGLTFRPS